MQIKVVKTNVTWPSCIEHHIGDRLNTFVTSIKVNAQKNSLHLGCPHYASWSKMDSVATWLSTKFQSLLSLNYGTKKFQSLIFGHHNRQPRFSIYPKKTRSYLIILVIQLIVAIDPTIECIFIVAPKKNCGPHFFQIMLEKIGHQPRWPKSFNC
jgi:hypothetical protein